jgi:hypothetical protein
LQVELSRYREDKSKGPEAKESALASKGTRVWGAK